MTSLTRRAVLAVPIAAAAAHVAGAAQARRTYIDGLSFLPEDLADIGRTRVDAMICDVSQVETVRDPDGTPRYRRTPARNLAALEAAAARLASSPHGFVARRGSDIGTWPGAAAFLQFQSAETVGRDLARLATYRDKGLSVLQFTHHNDTEWAGGCLEVRQSGLTPLGREGLAEMNRLRMLADVSHGAEATMLEAAAASRAPIVYSHGACRAIVDHPRCITDRAIRAIADRGGLCGVFMMSFWLTRAAGADARALGRACPPRHPHRRTRRGGGGQRLSDGGRGGSGPARQRQCQGRCRNISNGGGRCARSASLASNATRSMSSFRRSTRSAG